MVQKHMAALSTLNLGSGGNHGLGRVGIFVGMGFSTTTGKDTQ